MGEQVCKTVLQKTEVTTSALQERRIKGYTALESMGHVINREKVSLSAFSNLPNSSYGLKTWRRDSCRCREYLRINRTL